MSFVVKPKLVNCHTVFFAELECSSLWILSWPTFDWVVNAGRVASADILPHPWVSKSSARAQRKPISFPFQELHPLAYVTSSLWWGPLGRAWERCPCSCRLWIWETTEFIVPELSLWFICICVSRKYFDRATKSSLHRWCLLHKGKSIHFWVVTLLR